MAMTDDFLDEIENYALAHAGLDGVDARELCRSIWQGERFNLPTAKTDAGRAEQVLLEAALSAAQPAAVAATTPPPAAASSASEPVPMSTENRRVLFRQMAGPRLQPFADALAESPASFDEGKALIATAKADLLPESRLPTGYVTIEQRAAGQPEMGGSIDFAPPKPEVAKAGWDKAFSKLAGKA